MSSSRVGGRCINVHPNFEEAAVFDTTKTDIEFKRDFVHQDAEWLVGARPAEPDLEIEGLQQSLLSRLLSMLGLS